MKYNNVNFGQMEAVINKLGGEEKMKDFLSGKLIVFSFAEIGGKENFEDFMYEYKKILLVRDLQKLKKMKVLSFKDQQKVFAIKVALRIAENKKVNFV